MASIYDVAKRAGVSISTVSRVINKSAGVKPAKAEAVAEAMKFYEFEPSQAARGLATGATETIGVYTPHGDGGLFEDTYLLECLRGIDEIVSDSEYSLLLMNETSKYHKDQNQRPKFDKYVKQNRVDGLIMLDYPKESRLIEAYDNARSRKFPIIYIGKKRKNTGSNVYAGYTDYHKEALDRFIKNGHKNILYIYFGHEEAVEKIKECMGYEHPEVNLTLARLDSGKASDIKATIEKLAKDIKKLRITAALCDSVNVAEIFSAMLGMKNIRIPEDISMITVEHKRDSAEELIPPLSAYYVPARELGRKAAEILLKELKTHEILDEEEKLFPEYIDRGSVKNKRI